MFPSQVALLAFNVARFFLITLLSPKGKTGAQVKQCSDVHNQTKLSQRDNQIEQLLPKQSIQLH